MTPRPERMAPGKSRQRRGGLREGVWRVFHCEGREEPEVLGGLSVFAVNLNARAGVSIRPKPFAGVLCLNSSKAGSPAPEKHSSPIEYRWWFRVSDLYLAVECDETRRRESWSAPDRHHWSCSSAAPGSRSEPCQSSMRPNSRTASLSFPRVGLERSARSLLRPEDL